MKKYILEVATTNLAAERRARVSGTMHFFQYNRIDDSPGNLSRPLYQHRKNPYSVSTVWGMRIRQVALEVPGIGRAATDVGDFVLVEGGYGGQGPHS